MNHPALALLVRLKSSMPREKLVKIMEERAPQFRALHGLRQKYYLEGSEGEYAGLYLWDSAEDLAAYRESELRATITQAYETEGEPDVQVFRVIMSLRDERP